MEYDSARPDILAHFQISRTFSAFTALGYLVTTFPRASAEMRVP